jgi:hypothetical protein
MELVKGTFHRQHSKPIERKLLCILSVFFGNAPTTSRQGTLPFYKNQSQSINKVPTRFDVYIKGNRNDFFATRGADIAIVTGFGMDLLVIYY